MLRDLWSGLLELLAPSTCAACEELLLERSDGFCAGCALLVDEYPNPPHSQDRAACLYGGPLSEAIQRLKYRGASQLAPGLAGLLNEAAEPWIGAVDRVCVVPLHAKRLVERGYNQSALLARPVAHKLGARFDPWLLRRARETRTQVGSDPVQRRAQLRGSFTAQARAQGCKVLVIDDVRTTGATFEEARRALASAGAQTVYTLALAAHPGAAAPL
jgi:ComF family protein